MIIGYARVSTDQQTVENQVMALEKAGAERIFTETASGARDDRPQLAAALEYARPGDKLMVVRLDRIGRSLRFLIETINQMAERGIEFVSLTDSIDTTTASGRLTFHVMGALAEFERELIRERTQAGLERARARGVKGGRRSALSESQIRHMAKLAEDPAADIAEIGRSFGISRATAYRHIQSYRKQQHRRTEG